MTLRRRVCSFAIVVAAATAGCDPVVAPFVDGGVDGASQDGADVPIDAPDVPTDAPEVVNRTVTVAIAGNGTGMVTSAPAGLTCPGPCTITVAHGAQLTLTATPQGAAMFLGWSGGCTGVAPCTLTVTADTSVNASFALDHTLVVTRTGTGSGGVTSSPAGISCGADCDQTYPAGTMVTLTAAPSADSTFAGWSGGGCSGTGTCTVTINAATGVNAAFSLRRWTLTTARAGAGGGAIASSPAGITCGATCSASFDHGTVVTLTATADALSTFTGWSGGGCTGTGACTVTLTAAATVTGTFDPAQRTLTVVPGGNGSGTVTGAGISCGGDCSQSFAHGTMVTLTAAAAVSPLSAVSTFTGWSGGGCSGTGTCTVTMTAATSVTASFALEPNVAFVTATSYSAALGGVAGADAACQARAQAVNLPGTYRAWLSSSTSNAISRFGSASGWVRRDGRPFANSQADLTGGKIFYPLVLDERGGDAHGKTVRTATNPQGQWNSTSTCGEWTDAQSQTTSTSGNNDNSTFAWTSNGSIGCASSAALYCFGVDRAAAVAPAPQSNVRRAFVSNGSFVPSGGLTGADALCQSEAQAAGLPGTYRALLASMSPAGAPISAASRFTTAGTTWARVDNVVLAASAATFLGANTTYWDASLNVTATGAYGTGRVWAGAASVTTGGTGASTCGNWSSANVNGSAWVGIAQATETATAFANYTQYNGITSCDNLNKLYCLQQ